MSFYTDGTNRSVALPDFPRRIISLVPSQTELLHYLNLGDRVVGITKFCVHPPEWFRSKSRIGGTKRVNIARVKALQPDLVLAAKEENEKGDIDEIARFCPVWTSDVKTLPNALEMIRTVGRMTGSDSRAEALCADLHSAFSPLPPRSRADMEEGRAPDPTRQPRVAYAIWNDPIMVAGGDTFINDMLTHAGYSNVFAEYLRYPSITRNDLAQRECEVLFLSSEPFPFRAKHVKQFESLLPRTKVVLVDGEMFSWYGSRLLHAPPYFRQLYQQVVGNV